MTRRKFVFALPLLVAAALGVYWGAPLSAWAVGAGSHTVLETTARPLSAEETKKIEAYLRQVLGNAKIRLSPAPPDAEVWLGEHFLGVVFPDDRKDGRTFYFEMAMFKEEVEESPPAKRSR